MEQGPSHVSGSSRVLADVDAIIYEPNTKGGESSRECFTSSYPHLLLPFPPLTSHHSAWSYLPSLLAFFFPVHSLCGSEECVCCRSCVSEMWGECRQVQGFKHVNQLRCTGQIRPSYQKRRALLFHPIDLLHPDISFFRLHD